VALDVNKNLKINQRMMTKESLFTHLKETLGGDEEEKK